MLAASQRAAGGFVYAEDQTFDKFTHTLAFTISRQLLADWLLWFSLTTVIGHGF